MLFLISRVNIYKLTRERQQQISGCSAVGSALDWGSRGREFKSRHSDQKKSWNRNGFRTFCFSFLISWIRTAVEFSWNLIFDRSSFSFLEMGYRLKCWSYLNKSADTLRRFLRFVSQYFFADYRKLNMKKIAILRFRKFVKNGRFTENARMHFSDFPVFSTHK